MRLTKWEYTFLLTTCNLGERFQLGVNPFTGEEVRFPIDDGLTKQHIRSVKQVFALNGIKGPEPEFEGYAVYGSNGESLRFRSGDLENESIASLGVEIIVKKLSDEIVSIVFDVAKAGGFALSSSTGECVRLIDREPDSKLLARWPDAQTLGTNAELRRWIEETIGGRRVY